MATRHIARPPRHLAAIAVALALLAACSPSMEAVVAEHRPVVEAVFARVKVLADPARDAPTVAADRIDAGGARIVLDGDGSNALFIHVDDLLAPEFAGTDGTGATRASRVEGCGEALRGEFSGIAKGAALYLEECGRAEYVFVLRTHADEPARLVGSDSFEPGRYEGDVLLFRIADGMLLGGFRVSAESSDQVSVQMDSAGNPIDPIERLNSDLSSRVFVQIDEKLRALVPGVIP